MSGYFSATPVNFQRFLDFTRSASRSLSPENELRQMTVPKAPAAISQANNKSGSSPAVVDGEESESVKHESKSLIVMDEEDDHRDFEDAVAQVALWQYGSPLYHAVTDTFYCWNHHPLAPKDRRSYVDVEGVSCDFCGLTDWGSDAKPAGAAASSSTKTLASSSGSSVLEFYHCSTCGVDLCSGCIAEVREDVRCQVPCMECTRCHAFLPLHSAPTHRCQAASPKPAALKQTTKLEESLLDGDVAVPAVPPKKKIKTEPAAKAKAQRATTTSKSSRSKQSVVSQPPLVEKVATVKHAWEVLVTTTTAAEEEEVVRMAGDLDLEGLKQPTGYLFKLPTRLSAEKCARRAHEVGLLTSLRKA